MSKTIRITNIIGSPINGGIQNFLLAISKHDDKLKIKRTIICIYSIKGSLKHEFNKRNIQIFFCPIILNDNGRRPYFFWKKIRSSIGKIFFPIRFRSLILRINADLIICHEPKNLLEMIIVSNFLSIPFLNHMHKEFNYSENLYFFKYIFKNSKFISDSPELINSNLKGLKKIGLGSIDDVPIITSTGSLNKFSSRKNDLNDNVLKIGSIGRFNWEKNFQQMIDIAKKLKLKNQIKFKITIVGDGPEFIKIKTMIKENSLQETVFLKGEMERSEVIDFLNNLDLYIQTSISEGSPLTIKEAMASSLIVVSSDVGGIKSLIKNNIDGFLVKKNNTDDFVKIILKIINMKKDKKNEMRLKARESVLNKYSPEKIAEKYFDHIFTILENSR